VCVCVNVMCGVGEGDNCSMEALDLGWRLGSLDCHCQGVYCCLLRACCCLASLCVCCLRACVRACMLVCAKIVLEDSVTCLKDSIQREYAPV